MSNTFIKCVFNVFQTMVKSANNHLNSRSGCVIDLKFNLNETVNNAEKLITDFLNKRSSLALLKTVSIFDKIKDINMLNSFRNNNPVACTMMCMCTDFISRKK